MNLAWRCIIERRTMVHLWVLSQLFLCVLFEVLQSMGFLKCSSGYAPQMFYEKNSSKLQIDSTMLFCVVNVDVIVFCASNMPEYCMVFSSLIQ